jgi:hypothetical protein
MRNLDRLKQHSHLLFMTSERAGYIAMRLGLLGELEHAAAENFSEELGTLTQTLLAEIGRTAEQLGARTLFVYVPEKQVTFVDEEAPSRAKAVMVRAAGEVGASWVDLTPAFRSHPDRFNLYFKGDGHWTPAGNDFAAQVVAESIVSLGLLE